MGVDEWHSLCESMSKFRDRCGCGHWQGKRAGQSQAGKGGEQDIDGISHTVEQVIRVRMVVNVKRFEDEIWTILCCVVCFINLYLRVK